ncbi:MAG: hypothetical protein WDN69_17540 [Aliidongia sp.]
MDTRVNPTQVNLLATTRPHEWFERNVIGTVPMRYPGAFRRVYPGFLQLAGIHDHESRPACQRACRSLPSPGQGRWRERRGDAEILR